MSEADDVTYAKRKREFSGMWTPIKEAAFFFNLFIFDSSGHKDNNGSLDGEQLNHPKINEKQFPTKRNKLLRTSCLFSIVTLFLSRKLDRGNTTIEHLTIETSEVFVFLLSHQMTSHHRKSRLLWLRKTWSIIRWVQLFKGGVLVV